MPDGIRWFQPIRAPRDHPVHYPWPKEFVEVTEAEKRKAQPICSGVLDYFPDALLAIAECSRIGNDQHHAGQTLHWDRSKSTDEADALLRHMIGRGSLDSDGVRHSAKVAWRALAMLQKEIELERRVATRTPSKRR